MRVVVLHESELARAQLAAVLASLGVEIVDGGGPAETSRAAAAEVVILDGRAPAMPEIVASLRATAPAARLFVLAHASEIALVRAAVRAGADGAIRRPPLRSRVALALGLTP